MATYTKHQNQTATYWAPASSLSNTGDRGFATPVTLNCRWQSKVDLIRTPDGRQVASSAVVYPDQALSTGGWLYLGDATAAADPRNLAGAYEIINSGFATNLKSTLTLYKVWL